MLGALHFWYLALADDAGVVDVDVDVGVCGHGPGEDALEDAVGGREGGWCVGSGDGGWGPYYGLAEVEEADGEADEPVEAGEALGVACPIDIWVCGCVVVPVAALSVAEGCAPVSDEHGSPGADLELAGGAWLGRAGGCLHVGDAPPDVVDESADASAGFAAGVW